MVVAITHVPFRLEERYKGCYNDTRTSLKRLVRWNFSVSSIIYYTPRNGKQNANKWTRISAFNLFYAHDRSFHSNYARLKRSLIKTSPPPSSLPPFPGEREKERVMAQHYKSAPLTTDKLTANKKNYPLPRWETTNGIS